ncbi:MAG: flavodoxin [Proteobacteria bacterium SW_6_67_9]|nr:MAG: flavodoxin [Proteobacteria bacterium SW_6_67_9]
MAEATAAQETAGGANKRLLVVAHDPSPNTQRMVEAVLRGARSDAIEAVETVHVRPLEAGPEDVLAADATLLGTTENLGYMSGALKDFFDRTYYNVGDETEGMPYALYVRAGMDGTGTRRAVESICTGLQWRPVQDPLICRGKWDDAFLEQCEELGMYMAAGLDAGIL